MLWVYLRECLPMLQGHNSLLPPVATRSGSRERPMFAVFACVRKRITITDTHTHTVSVHNVNGDIELDFHDERSSRHHRGSNELGMCGSASVYVCVCVQID